MNTVSLSDSLSAIVTAQPTWWLCPPPVRGCCGVRRQPVYPFALPVGPRLCPVASSFLTAQPLTTAGAVAASAPHSRSRAAALLFPPDPNPSPRCSRALLSSSAVFRLNRAGGHETSRQFPSLRPCRATHRKARHREARTDLSAYSNQELFHQFCDI